MTDIADVPSPGGWLQTYGVRVARGLAIGTVGVAAVVTIFGSLNGRQASQYCEVALGPVSKSGAQIARCPNPLTQTGFVVADNDSYVYVDSVIPSPISTLIIGVGTKTSTGTQIASMRITKGNNVLTLLGSGATKLPSRVRVSPGQSLTFAWYSGSGQTTGGVSTGFARIKLEPCGTPSFNCD